MNFEYIYGGLKIKCHNIHSDMSDLSKNIVKTYFSISDKIDRSGIYANDGKEINIYLYEGLKLIIEKSYSLDKMSEKEAHYIISAWVNHARQRI